MDKMYRLLVGVLLVPFQLVAANGRELCSTYVAFTEASLSRRKWLERH